MEASPRVSGSRRAWAWALVVSVVVHVLGLALLLVVRVPSLALPVELAPSPEKMTLFRVGMLSGSPPGPSARAAVGGQASASPVVGARPAAETSQASGAAPDGELDRHGEAVTPGAKVSDAPPPDGTPSATRAGEGGRVPAGDVGRPAVERPGGALDGLAKGGAAEDQVERADAARGGAEDGVERDGAAEDGVAKGSGGSRDAVGGADGLSGREGGAGAAVGGAAGGGASAGSAGPELVSLVHARLAAAAERCYPASARRFQQRGTVEVRFCVDGHGAVREEQVQRSSGVDALDAAVGACVLPAASPFPSSASGQCFSVPVRFGLR
ncbi:MAG: TonB family protein [Myxococcota bacterium]